MPSKLSAADFYNLLSQFRHYSHDIILILKTILSKKVVFIHDYSDSKYTKYPAYASNMIMPHGRRNCRCRIVPIQSNMPQRIAMTVSIRNLPSNGTGQMSATVPITNRILNILLPTIFPISLLRLMLQVPEAMYRKQQS